MSVRKKKKNNHISYLFLNWLFKYLEYNNWGNVLSCKSQGHGFDSHP